MTTLQRLTMLSAFALFAISAQADDVYVLTSNQQFGTMDWSSGAFTPIGPGTPENGSGLVAGPNGTFQTLTYAGNLATINGATGVVTSTLATGLGDCTTLASPCGMNSANTLGSLGSKLYATDLANNLYSVNQVSGLATLIGSTGIPVVSYVPTSMNADGSYNLFDESLFGSGGNLYATFDEFATDFDSIFNLQVAPELYQINPLTGAATAIGPTDLTLLTGATIGDTSYGYRAGDGSFVSLDLATGDTTVVGTSDPNAGMINGFAVAETPEPASLALVGSGLAMLFKVRRRSS